MYIGSHVSYASEGLLGSTKQALSYNANTFMFYTGAPQNTIRKAIDVNNTNKAHELMNSSGIDINKVICHAPYIINLANKLKPDAWQFGIDFLKAEIKRCEELGVKYIVLHPGSAVGQERNVAIKNISDALNYVIDVDTNCVILLETMAGKGTECGINTLELKQIIDGVIYKDKIGVCLDTCHLNDSGIDIKNFDEYLDEFDNIIGISNIGCVHVNDSMNVLGSHKDRHANLGFGEIGFDSLINVIYNKRLENVPKILETPYIGEYAPYKFEIEMIKNKKFDAKMKEKVVDYYQNI